MPRVRSVATCVVLTVGAAVVVAAPALTASADPAARTYYVEPSDRCDDTGQGRQDHPFCTLQPAADVVNPGDTVRIVGSDGVSVWGATTLKRSGTPTAPITIVGSGTGNDPVSLASSQQRPLLTLAAVHDVVVRDLNLYEGENQNAVRIVGAQRVSLTSVRAVAGLGVVAAGRPVQPLVAIDGASSEVTVTTSELLGAPSRPTVAAAAGARRVTITTNRLEATGAAVALDGVTEGVVTGNSMTAYGCGPALVVTGKGGTTGREQRRQRTRPP